MHVPDAVYLLLLAIADLKQFCRDKSEEIEISVIENLVKFCRQYEGH